MADNIGKLSIALFY